MAVTESTVKAAFEREMALATDQRVREHVQKLVIRPRVEMRGWDYGSAGQEYPCWLVLAHTPSNTGIAYCESGFGPSHPWGVLFLEGSEYMSMGMDSGWFAHFLDAYFDSMASADLPIWRVFQRQDDPFPGKPISEEGSWESTWAQVKRLRAENPNFKYECWQSVYVPDWLDSEDGSLDA